MYAKLLGLLLITCQIISNESHEIHPVTDYISLIHVDPTPAPATLPDGYTSYPEKHIAYKLHEEYLTWDAARDRCNSEGGHLAIADSESKIHDIINSRDFWGTHRIHVGIRRSNTTANEWVRIDNGLPCASLNWVESPSSDGPDCVFLYIPASVLWNYPCDHEEWFICEIRI